MFRRDALDAQLVRPLRASLAGRTPTVKGVESSPGASLVERLTKVLYTPSLSQANADAGLFLVLKPFDPKDTSSQSSGSGSSGSSDATTDPSQALQLPSP